MAQFEIAFGPQGQYMLDGGNPGQSNFGNGSQSQFDPLSYVLPAVGGIFGQIMDYAAQQEQMTWQHEMADTQWERYQESLELQNMYATNNMQYAQQIQEDLMDKSMQMQEEYDTNKYVRQVQGARKAGINPLYGLSGASGQLVNTAPAAPSGGGYAGYQGQIPSYQRTTGSNPLSGFGSYFRDTQLAKLQASQSAVNYASIPQIQSDIKRLNSFAALLNSQELTERKKRELMEAQKNLTFEQVTSAMHAAQAAYLDLQDKLDVRAGGLNPQQEEIINNRLEREVDQQNANTQTGRAWLDLARLGVEILFGIR